MLVEEGQEPRPHAAGTNGRTQVQRLVPRHGVLSRQHGQTGPSFLGVPPAGSTAPWNLRPSERILVSGEAAQPLLNGLEAGSGPRIRLPAGQHQPVHGRWAHGRAGHAVAGIHFLGGLMVGHTCSQKAWLRG